MSNLDRARHVRGRVERAAHVLGERQLGARRRRQPVPGVRVTFRDFGHNASPTDPADAGKCRSGGGERI